MISFRICHRARFLAALLLFAMTIDSYGWLMVTHYNMLADGRYANGPDLFSTKLYAWQDGLIAPDFLWSHGLVGIGAQGGGTVWEDTRPSTTGQWAWMAVWFTDESDTTQYFKCPNAPTTAVCPEPGHVMWKLLSEKMDQDLSVPGRGDWSVMQNTARGWAAHNAADHVVHFSYFKAGDANTWIGEHGLKEEWAELVVIVLANGGTFPDPWLSPALYATSDAGIINLAQKVFRKNGFAVDSGTNPRPEAVRSSAAIAAALAQKASTDQAIANNYSADRFQLLQTHLQLHSDPTNPHYHDWGVTSLFSKYTEAQLAASNALSEMP